MKVFYKLVVNRAKRYTPWVVTQMLRCFMMIWYAAVVVGYFAQFHWYFKTGIHVVDTAYTLLACYVVFLIYFHFVSVYFCGPGTSANTKLSSNLVPFDPGSADLSATLNRDDCIEALTHIAERTRGKIPDSRCSIASSTSTCALTKATELTASISSSSSFLSTSLLPPSSSCRSCGPGVGPRPLRSRHCDACGVCVLRKDYHCSWMGTCIGKRNHTHFLVFLMWVAVVCSVYVWRVGSVVASTGCVPSLLYGVDTTVQQAGMGSASGSSTPPVFPVGGDSRAVYGSAFPRAFNHMYGHVSSVGRYPEEGYLKRMSWVQLASVLVAGNVPVCRWRLDAAGQAIEPVETLRTDGIATVWAVLFPRHMVDLHDNSVLFLSCCYAYMLFAAISAGLLAPLHLWLSVRDDTTSHLFKSLGIGYTSPQERADDDDKGRHVTLGFVRRLRQRVLAAFSASLSVLLRCCKAKRTPLVSTEEAELLWTLAAQRACAAASGMSATTATSLVASSTRSSPVDDGDSSDVWGDAREDAHLVELKHMRQRAPATSTVPLGDVFGTGICGELTHHPRAGAGAAAVEVQKRAWLREWAHCPSVGPHTPVEDLAYQRGWRGALHRRFSWNIPWQWRSSPQLTDLLSKNEKYSRDDDDGESAMAKLPLPTDTSSGNNQDPESSHLRSPPVPSTPALLLQALGACVLPVWTDTAHVETLHPWAVLLLEHVSRQARMQV